jgi:hypothetical protein
MADLEHSKLPIPTPPFQGNLLPTIADRTPEAAGRTRTPATGSSVIGCSAGAAAL